MRDQEGLNLGDGRGRAQERNRVRVSFFPRAGLAAKGKGSESYSVCEDHWRGWLEHPEPLDI